MNNAQIWVLSNLIVDGLHKLTASPHANDRQLLEHLQTSIPLLERSFPGFEEQIRRLQGPKEEPALKAQQPLPF